MLLTSQSMAEKLPMTTAQPFYYYLRRRLPPELHRRHTHSLSSTNVLQSFHHYSGNTVSLNSFMCNVFSYDVNHVIDRIRCCCWRAAKVRVCADGGANRLFDNMPELFLDEHDDVSVIRERYKPDIIKGDMDSIRPDVLNFYRNLGTKIVDNSSDQDTTDLHKCITYVLDFMSDDEKSNLCILVAGAVGGRFDHEMGNVNRLCRFSATQIVLLSDDCLVQLLPSTRHHEIHVLSSVEGPHCGLIPIGTPSGSSTTTGLRWNLDNTEMRFGSLVSISNIVKGEKVTVRSDSDLLWTISLKKQT